MSQRRSNKWKRLVRLWRKDQYGGVILAFSSRHRCTLQVVEMGLNEFDQEICTLFTSQDAVVPIASLTKIRYVKGKPYRPVTKAATTEHGITI